jgi:hypothetical protein
LETEGLIQWGIPSSSDEFLKLRIEYGSSDEDAPLCQFAIVALDEPVKVLAAHQWYRQVQDYAIYLMSDSEHGSQ